MEQTLRRWFGRIAGSVIGMMAGPIGVVFGFLVGALIDQFRGSGGTPWRVERFLREPGREPNDRYAVTFARALLRDLLYRAGDSALPLPVWLAECSHRVMRAPNESLVSAIHAAIESKNHDAVCDAALERLDRVPLTVRQGLGRDLMETVPHDMTQRQWNLLVAVATRWEMNDECLSRFPHGGVVLDEQSCQLLDVDQTATAEGARRAFRRLAAQWHPDTATTLDRSHQTTLEQTFVRIRGAYELITEQIAERERRLSGARRDS